MQCIQAPQNNQYRNIPSVIYFLNRAVGIKGIIKNRVVVSEPKMRISEDNFGLSVETLSFLSTLRPLDKDGFYKLIWRYFSVNCILAFLIKSASAYEFLTDGSR